MPSIDNLEDSDNLRGLTWMISLTQLFGISMVVMMGIWLNNDLGGFAWDGSGKQFNLHPLSMVCGFVFLYAQSGMVFRIFRNTPKTKVKTIHACLHLLAFSAAVLGLVAVFGFHNANNIANMYSLHSWFGMATVLLFAFQFLFGFLAFLIPGAQAKLRAFYLPVHKFFGVAILMVATIACVSGINEKLFFIKDKDKKQTYPSLPSGAILGNMCGVMIALFVLSVLYTLHRTEWALKRVNQAESVSLLRERQRSHESSDE